MAPSADPPPTPTSHNPDPASSDSEDDYLKMSFDNPTTTSTSKTSKSITALHKSRQHHAETAGRPKSKAELRAEEERRRTEGLARRIGEGDDAKTNKGLAMMRKLGWKEGSALGAKPFTNTITDSISISERTTNNGNGNEDGARDGNSMAPTPAAVAATRLDPLTVEIKDGREGIGLESERKRKVREEFARAEQGEKRRKVEEGEYRERVAREREERRVEGQCAGAMRVLEGLYEEDERRQQEQEQEQEEKAENEKSDGEGSERKRKKPGTRFLGSIPVLYRGLVKARRIDERDQRMRHDLLQSLSRNPAYTDNDPEEDADDKIALGKNGTLEEVDDADLDQDDEELAMFEALEPRERLGRLVAELRERWCYCFWCKWRYRNRAEMEGEGEGEGGCPGVAEEDHD